MLLICHVGVGVYLESEVCVRYDDDDDSEFGEIQRQRAESIAFAVDDDVAASSGKDYLL